MTSKIEFNIVDEETGKEKIVIHKSIIKDELKNKISDKDIERSQELISSMSKIRKIYFDLLSETGCSNKYNSCAELESDYIKNQCRNKSLPFGNINADIMFVKKIPSVLECGSLMSHSDTAGHFLLLILDKIGKKPTDFFFTDFIKCPNPKIDIDSCWQCAMNYFMKEVCVIKPKLLIFEGTSALKALMYEKIITGINDIQYGEVYNVNFLEHSTQVMCIYDIDLVLQKEGKELQDAKNNLWMFINKAIRLVT
jgi:uracil-DNA glycosylase family 4